MSTWGLPLTCALCGNECAPVTIGAPIAGREVNAIVVCRRGHEWLVRAFMVPIASPVHIDAPSLGKGGCGTDSGYKAHIRNKTERCTPCKAAHAVAEANRKTKRRRVAVGGAE